MLLNLIFLNIHSQQYLQMTNYRHLFSILLEKLQTGGITTRQVNATRRIYGTNHLIIRISCGYRFLQTFCGKENQS